MGLAKGQFIFEGRDGLLDNIATNLNGTNGTATYTSTSGAGLTDVMFFDASEMTGRANISAAITADSSPKYFGDTDQVAGTGTQYAPNGGEFGYNFGSANDTLNMVIDGNVAADNDFVMTINMNGGNDSVRTQFVQQGTDTNYNYNWISNQHNLANVTINTGEGNDIVNPFGTGSVNVNAGAGNDIVYSDNSGIDADSSPSVGSIKGVGAIYVLNAQNDHYAYTVNASNGNIVPVQNAITSHINPEFKGELASTYTSGNMQMTVNVTYKGITGTSFSKSISIGSDSSVSITASEVNEMILSAVNDSDGWLSALMSAQEGAGNSLLLISKVDGQVAFDALDIQFTYAVNGTTITPTTALQAYDEATGGNVNLSTWYNPDTDTTAGGHKQFAVDAATNWNIEGNDSNAEADNYINLGSGDDLAVLSTGSTSNETIVLEATNNGNDTIVNFDLSANVAGKDVVDASAILGGAPSAGQVLPTGATLANAVNGITPGSSTNQVRSIVFLQNAAATTDADYIANAADLKEVIDKVSHTTLENNVVLYMVYDNDPSTAAATFTMYKATFGTGGNVTVDSCSSLTFADFIYTDSGITHKDGYTVQDFLKGDVANMFDTDNRLDNGPSAMEPASFVRVTNTTGPFDASKGYIGDVSMFLDSTGIAATGLIGDGNIIRLTSAIGDDQYLEDYGTGQKTPPITTIELYNTNGNSVDFDDNNAKYNWDGKDVTKAITFDVADAGMAVGGDAANPAAGSTLWGGSGGDTYNISADFAGQLLGGSAADTFNITLAGGLTANATLNGGGGDDTIVIGDGTTAVTQDLTSGITVTAIENITVKADSSVTTNDASYKITLDGASGKAATANITAGTETDTIILAAASQDNVVTGFVAGTTKGDVVNVSAFVDGKAGEAISVDLGAVGSTKTATFANDGNLLFIDSSAKDVSDATKAVTELANNTFTGYTDAVLALVSSDDKAYLYYWDNDDNDTAVDSGELTLIGTITPTTATEGSFGTSNFSATDIA